MTMQLKQRERHIEFRTFSNCSHRSSEFLSPFLTSFLSFCRTASFIWLSEVHFYFSSISQQFGVHFVVFLKMVATSTNPNHSSRSGPLHLAPLVTDPNLQHLKVGGGGSFPLELYFSFCRNFTFINEIPRKLSPNFIAFHIVCSTWYRNINSATCGKWKLLRNMVYSQCFEAEQSGKNS